MPKTLPPPPGKCVHCLKDPVERTWDHVFPRSWYPDTTPSQNFKWKIPTCLPCNKKYGDMEQEMLIRLGLCPNPRAISASGIASTVLRALDPGQARNERDRLYRQGKRDKILREIGSNATKTDIVIYPGFEEKWGRSLQEQTRISIPAKSIERLTEKIVRGIIYLNDNRFIEPPYVIECFTVNNKDWDDLTDILTTLGNTYENGPGISIHRAAAFEDQTTSMFSIVIWGQLKMVASVLIPDLIHPT